MSTSKPSKLPILGAALAVVIFVSAGVVYFYETGQQGLQSSTQVATSGAQTATYVLTEIPTDFEVGAYSLHLLCNGAPCVEASSSGTVTETTGYAVILAVSYQGANQTMTFLWPPTPPPLTVPSPASASVFSGGLGATWSANSTGVYVTFSTATG